MGYDIKLYKIKRPTLEDIKHDPSSVFRLDSFVREELESLGLGEKIIKLAGKYYIGVEEVEDANYPRRLSSNYTSDYYNPEVRSQGNDLGWNIITRKSRLEEIKEKYVLDELTHPSWKVYFEEKIVNKFQEGSMVYLRRQ